MGNKEKVLELLKTEALTGSQIAEKLHFSEDQEQNKNQIRVYLNRLVKYNLIEVMGDNKRNQLYRAKISNDLDTQILKKILVKFVDLEVKLDNTTEIEDKRIMELIKECQLI